MSKSINMSHILSIIFRSVALLIAFTTHIISIVCYARRDYGFVADIGLAVAIIANASAIALSADKHLSFSTSRGYRLFAFAADTLVWVSLSTAGTLDATILFKEAGLHSYSSYVHAIDELNPMVVTLVALILFLAYVLLLPRDDPRTNFSCRLLHLIASIVGLVKLACKINNETDRTEKTSYPVNYA
ncbi:hypothetical protein EJ08DRAFT_651811 [Tothia fuscella]|uniref:Uncharacterized protein n=1 Tax=Tothia fuscella TaxID=1048955 RepID=A0A9P4NLB1_9PEZI|nr:hypothetical protein EJ08DRAFT_651811 [Tothia fuscella]